LERYVEYGIRDEGDSVLFILDCDDLCPVEVCKQFMRRIEKLNPSKKVGIALFNCEFESIFLHCIDEIKARFTDYGWLSQPPTLPADIETIRDAKGRISRMMSADHAYKETRDQVKFITALDYDKLRNLSRSFRHFERLLLWLATGESPVYPVIL
jgi:hypothetical protein